MSATRKRPKMKSRSVIRWPVAMGLAAIAAAWTVAEMRATESRTAPFLALGHPAEYFSGVGTGEQRGDGSQSGCGPSPRSSRRRSGGRPAVSIGSSSRMSIVTT
jgi:hypothetical protein